MLPAARSLLNACAWRWRPTRRALRLLVCGVAIAGTAGVPALAQSAEPVAAAPTLSEAPADQAPVAFEADRVAYDDKQRGVTASGNVVLRRGDQSVRADSVTWDRTSGEIIASGNVRMVDQDGNQLFTEQVTLTDEFRTGAMENMLLAMRAGGRLAAESGERNDDGSLQLHNAAYTGCEIEDADGCSKEPSWRITAKEVHYDQDRKEIRFTKARITLLDKVSLPLFALKLATDGRAISGALVPDLRFTPSNGVEINDSYYWRIADNRDLTATGYVYTDVLPMVSAQYRALTSKGAYQVTGYATTSSRISIRNDPSDPSREFRGYIFANGRFQLDPHWSVTGVVRRVTDRTFLRRYDLSRDDRLRSMIDIERISNRTYLSIAGWSTQTMRFRDRQGQVPFALPAVDLRHRLARTVFGGRVEFQANSLAILRTSGQETQRAFAGARWDLRRYTNMGQLFSLTGLVRGDIYHSDENEKTVTPIYRGLPGWRGRGIAIGAVDVQWPLAGRAFKGTQVLTPRVQMVVSPRLRNLGVPNEDARAIDLEDSNLFSLNRFPGYDRVEEGVRFTYGLDWQFEQPRWRVKANVGQSLRLNTVQNLLPDGTGLSSRTSDVVGRVEVRYRDFINVVQRFRLDKDNLSIRRQEFDATIGNRRTYAEVGYLRLNRDIDGLEDLKDREEVRLAGRMAFARYWSVFGSAVVNLTNRSDDPVFGSDGFQPLRTRIGAAYQDDCLEISATWRRDYAATGDARKGNSFQIHFALRNLGVR